MQLLRKVSYRVEKAQNWPHARRYQRAPSGAFSGEGQQSSHGTVVGRGQKVLRYNGASLVQILPRH